MAFVLPALALLALGLVVVAILRLLRPGASGVDVLLAVGVGSLALLAGPWPVLGVHLRTLLALALGIAMVAGRVRGLASRSAARSTGWSARAGLKLFGVVILALLNALALKGLLPGGPAIDLEFPLRDGAYAVLQGGDSPLTNVFHRYRPSSRHALDIVKLNRWGTRARGLAPSELDRYEIFGEQLYSPCAGSVLESRGDLSDNPPGEVEPGTRRGNYLLLRCRDATVLMAHLMYGSPVVEAGQRVAAGDPIGRVGNSGLTNEPHLHLAASSATGGPARRPRLITFGGRVLSANSVVRVGSGSPE